MHHYNEKQLLAEKLRGQMLIIPDMLQTFINWPRGENENYPAVKDIINKRMAAQPMEDEARRAFDDTDPALLAARWWPNSSKNRYQVLVDLITWFFYWDDRIEELAADPRVAEDLRNSTKALVRLSFGFPKPEDADVSITDPLVLGFRDIGAKISAAYDEEQRRAYLSDIERYIDSTQLEAEAELSEKLPTLKKYWEVRILTSGMGVLLGCTEFVAEAKLPTRVASSAAYEALKVTAVMINSIVNDLISFKKEMKAGSVLSSVAILYQQVGSLNAAVQMTLAHLRILVDEFDRGADAILSGFNLSPEEADNVTKVIRVLREVNTGNLEWSLGSKRYGVTQFIDTAGQIELVL